MLELKNVNKRFKSALIAENINVKFENCTYGLLGRNGSGKTTLLRYITNIEKINSGSIAYYDENGNAVKNYLDRIGYLPQSFDIFGDLTPPEVLEFFANLKEYKISKEEIRDLLKNLNLSDKEKAKVKTLSGGMKRRLGIAQALVGNPEILFLDEPTSGLDPEERLNFKNVIRAVKKDRCVVLSTHIITDIESLCDKVMVLQGGKITQFDSCRALADVAKGRVFAVENPDKLEQNYYSMGDITIDGKSYEKVISKGGIDGAVEIEPTVEDGYICFIENLY